MNILNFIRCYSFLVDLSIAIIGALYGGIYLRSTIKRRSEAKYGFYINFLQFIYQLEVFNIKDIIQLMAKTDAHRQSYKPSHEVITGFRELSEKFLSFLDSSKDIIPPSKCKKKIWYNNQLVIVRFLQWGTMADYLHPIDNEPDAAGEIDRELDNISDALDQAKLDLGKAIGFSFPAIKGDGGMRRPGRRRPGTGRG
jgi:hypothetical protein